MGRIDMWLLTPLLLLAAQLPLGSIVGQPPKSEAWVAKTIPEADSAVAVGFPVTVDVAFHAAFDTRVGPAVGAGGLISSSWPTRVLMLGPAGRNLLVTDWPRAARTRLDLLRGDTWREKFLLSENFEMMMPGRYVFQVAYKLPGDIAVAPRRLTFDVLEVPSRNIERISLKILAAESSLTTGGNVALTLEFSNRTKDAVEFLAPNENSIAGFWNPLVRIHVVKAKAAPSQFLPLVHDDDVFYADPTWERPTRIRGHGAFRIKMEVKLAGAGLLVPGEAVSVHAHYVARDWPEYISETNFREDMPRMLSLPVNAVVGALHASEVILLVKPEVE